MCASGGLDSFFLQLTCLSLLPYFHAIICSLSVRLLLRWLLGPLMSHMGLPHLWIWENCSFAPVLDMTLVREEVFALFMPAPWCTLSTDLQRPTDTVLWHLLSLSLCTQDFLTHHYTGPEDNLHDTQDSGLKIAPHFGPIVQFLHQNLGTSLFLSSCFIKDTFGEDG